MSRSASERLARYSADRRCSRWTDLLSSPPGLPTESYSVPMVSSFMESPTVTVAAKPQSATSEVSGIARSTETLNRMDLLDAMSPQRFGLGAPGGGFPADL